MLLYPPTPSDAPFVKRVIGVPGDKVELLNGNLRINGVVQKGAVRRKRMLRLFAICVVLKPLATLMTY